MPGPMKSRYAELKRVAESLAAVDVTDEKLPRVIGRLRRQAEKALAFKQAPRNNNMAGAREAARLATKNKADAFRARILPAIAEARKGGAETVREIADALNKAEVKAPRGGAWSAGSVFRFLSGN